MPYVNPASRHISNILTIQADSLLLARLVVWPVCGSAVTRRDIYFILFFSAFLGESDPEANK